MCSDLTILANDAWDNSNHVRNPGLCRSRQICRRHEQRQLHRRAACAELGGSEKKWAESAYLLVMAKSDFSLAGLGWLMWIYRELCSPVRLDQRICHPLTWLFIGLYDLSNNLLAYLLIRFLPFFSSHPTSALLLTVRPKTPTTSPFSRPRSRVSFRSTFERFVSFQLTLKIGDAHPFYSFYPAGQQGSNLIKI